MRAGCILVLCLLSAALAGCGVSLGERVAVEDVSFSPPAGWSLCGSGMDTGVLLQGEEGRVKVSLLDVSGTVETGLIDVLAMEFPELSVQQENAFTTENAEGTEFLVEYDRNGTGEGAVYMLRAGDRLCVMNFVADRGPDNELEKVRAIFRASAASLRFKRDENRDSQS